MSPANPGDLRRQNGGSTASRSLVAARHGVDRLGELLTSRQAVVAATTGLGAAYLLLYAWGMQQLSYHVWGALFIGPILVAITIPLATRQARREGDRWTARLIVVALLLKMGGAVARYAVAFDLYGGSADASVYHRWGVRVSESVRRLDFDIEVGRTGGTAFIRIFTGYVYAFIGPTRLGGFLVYSVIGFWGLYFFWRAFCVGFPDGNRRRYAVLVFLLPSLVFWPSSIGKEAWMMFALGLTAYGAARVLTHQRFAYPVLAAGLGGAVIVRPHVALLVALAIIFAFALRRARRPSPTAPAMKLAGLALLAVAGLALIGVVENRFGVDGGIGALDTVLDDTTEQTTQGGSQIAPRRARTPLDLPLAAFDVLFRPLPYDAHNAQALAASMEGVLLLGLFVAARRRLVEGFRLAARTPYLAFAISYALLFVFAFSSFGNFGMMARQRVQVLPLVLVLLAVPAVSRRRAPAAPRQAAAVR